MKHLMSVVAAAVAGTLSADVLFTEDFSGRTDSKWVSDSTNFTYSANEGVGGGRALVWECAEPCEKWQTFRYTFPCEVGRDYSYRVQARDTKAIIGRVYVRIGCIRKGGKTRFFTLQGRPIVNNGWKGVRKNFVEISGCTPPIPAGAESCVVEFAVMGRTTGRMVFDDLEIVRGGYTCIRYVQSGAYRDEAVDGKVRFAAFYGYDPEKCPLANRRAAFEYVARDGKVKRVASADLTETAFTAELDVGDLAAGAHPVAAILTDADGKAIDRRELVFSRVTTPTRRMVTIDSHRRLIVDGKPFFPIGCYGCGKDEARSDLYASAGFNCALTGNPEAVARMKKRGIKVIYSACGVNSNQVQKVVSKYGKDPDVIAWYTADELPPGFAKRQAAIIRRFHELDPDRPTFTVLDQPLTARDLLESFDIIGTDPYPICNNGQKISHCLRCADTAKEATFGLRPVWQVPQAFDWHWHRRNFRNGMAQHHFPYPDEFANMTWQAVVAGATGIVWYDFDWFEKDIPAEERDAAWACFKETAGRLGRYADVFLSIAPAPAATADSKDVRVRTWRYAGTTYLLAVSVNEKDPVTVRVKGLSAAKARAEFGPAPAVEGGEVVLGLPKLGVSFVRVD